MENFKKYGPKGNDIIAKQFEISYISGVSFCLGNVQKYLTRYISNSDKSNNINDIVKVYDYLSRLNTETYNFDVLYKIYYIMDMISHKKYQYSIELSIDLQKEIVKDSIN